MQGYLSANRFGEAISGSHAGLTAEGDNRVLMQKVSKELLSTIDRAEVKKHAIYAKLPGRVRRTLLGTGMAN